MDSLHAVAAGGFDIDWGVVDEEHLGRLNRRVWSTGETLNFADGLDGVSGFEAVHFEGQERLFENTVNR